MVGRLCSAAIAAWLFIPSASALDFRSVGEPAAILYDAPSLKAQKLYILSQGYPVEIVVKLEGWSKVRDDTGEFAWVENGHLSDRRTVMVKVAGAEIRQAANENAAIVFTAEKRRACVTTVPPAVAGPVIFRLPDDPSRRVISMATAGVSESEVPPTAVAAVATPIMLTAYLPLLILPISVPARRTSTSGVLSGSRHLVPSIVRRPGTN